MYICIMCIYIYIKSTKDNTKHIWNKLTTQLAEQRSKRKMSKLLKQVFQWRENMNDKKYIYEDKLNFIRIQ